MISSARAVIRCFPQINNLLKYNVINNKSTNLSNIQRSFSVSASAWSRLFTEKHEWVSVNGDTATVGISDYAQDAIGDLVFAEFPEVGREISQDEECGTIESVKSASEIYSPVSGTVLEKNEEAEETPTIINKSCYDKGWLFKVTLKNKDELNNLLSEEQYKQFLESSKH